MIMRGLDQRERTDLPPTELIFSSDLTYGSFLAPSIERFKSVLHSLLHSFGLLDVSEHDDYSRQYFRYGLSVSDPIHIILGPIALKMDQKWV